MRTYKPATFQPTIRPDWAGVLSYLTQEEKSEILVALFKYPSVECKSAFWNETIKPDLDLQYSEFTRICAEKSRGVRNRWGKTSITNEKTSITNVIVPEREREEEQESKKENIPSNWNTRVAPTENEVLEYARQQNEMAGMGGFAVTEQQAQDFYDHYSGVGWCLTNDAQTPIRDWRPLLRKWVRNPRFVSTPVKDANDDAYEADLRFFAHRKRDRELEQQKRKEANK